MFSFLGSGAMGSNEVKLSYFDLIGWVQKFPECFVKFCMMGCASIDLPLEFYF